MRADTRWRRIAGLLFAVGWGANHFAALLPVYRRELALDDTAPALLFGAYAIGLVPGLLAAGPLSDRHGRRIVGLPAAAGALVASLVLAAGRHSIGALLVGRLLYGLAAGAAMSAGSAWLLEQSQPGAGPRRATIALSSGFGFGPLVTGALAELLPAPTLVPFVLHAAAIALALAGARAVPDTGGRLDRTPASPIGAGWWRFAREVAPMAPFVFAFPTIAFAALPSLGGTTLGSAYIGVLAATTLASGIVVQPVAARFDPTTGARLGLVLGGAGIGIGAVALAADVRPLLLAAAPVLGAAYGACMTSGLRAVERIAPPGARGRLAGVYYVLAYIGFAAPYLLALAARSVRPEAAVATTALLALAAAVGVRGVRAT